MVHKTRIYIDTFPEHARWLVENSRHEVWVVYLNSKDRPMERLTKENYGEICSEIERCYKEKILADGLFIVANLGELTIHHSKDSRDNHHVTYNSDYKHPHLKFN
jgi:hypothetical protein